MLILVLYRYTNNTTIHLAQRTSGTVFSVKTVFGLTRSDARLTGSQ